MTATQHDEVLNKLNKTFQEVFNDDDIQLTDNTTAADIEQWDSLTNVRLLIQIEQDFNISFNISEIADIPNVGELVDIIISRI
jgi:acyl carrier protein